MKVIESYGPGTVAGCRDTNSGLLCLVISDFPSTSYRLEELVDVAETHIRWLLISPLPF